MPVSSPRILRNLLLVLGFVAILGACSPSPAQDKGFRDAFNFRKPIGAKALAQFKVAFTDAESPDEVLLTVQATVPPEHYIYSTNDDGAATRIEIESPEGLEPVLEHFTSDPPAKPVFDSTFNRDVEKVYDHVTWTQRYRLKPGTQREGLRFAGQVAYQICDKSTCRIAKSPFDVVLVSTNRVKTPEEPAKEATTPTAPFDETPAPPEKVENIDPAGNDGSEKREVIDQATGPAVGPPVIMRGIDKSQGMLWFILRAMGFGFAALLTPCSFPMVPITVSFFHKQAEKEHHRPVFMALVYCAGIIGTFTILGLVMSALFGGAALNDFANNPWFNLFMALMLVFFALNLLGMFEIRMPSWLLTYTATREGRGGIIGVLFMALTFTLTSFTCTFAFVGTVVVDAANGERLWPLVGLCAFSTAFSLPFFFLALFPSYLQKLPRSGGWMNVVKVMMGMLELGAAFKFFSNADLAWNPVAAIFDYELVMSGWMVISIASAMYLLAMFRLPHDVATEQIGVGRFMAAMSFLGLAAYLAVGLYSTNEPTGKVWENIAAFAPPKFKGGSGQFGPTIEHGGIKYALDFQRALEYAAKENKPLFLDFTGVNCTNCRLMERGPLSRSEVTSRLKNFVCVQLYADKVPQITDAAEAGRLKKFNVELQTNWFGDSTLPSYAVIPPDPNIAAAKEGENLLAVVIGYDPDEQKFAQFLDVGYQRWQILDARRTGDRAVGQR